MLPQSIGYEIDWQRFSQNDIGRDLLYIARDSSVNEPTKPHVQHENTMRKILHTQDGLKGNKALVELLNDAVRPSRAVAFEQMPEREALAQYPELEEAYKTMHAAAARYALKMPDKIEAQEASLRSTISDVQLRLNAGETAKFSRG